MSKLTKILSCILTIILTVCILLGLTKLFERKYYVEKYNDFFEHTDDYDVLFMGSSKVLNGFLPMEIWDDYGISSYNFGGHANMIPTTYWVMENALDYCKPKLMVVDGTLLFKYKRSQISYLHSSFDEFPLSKTKIEAIMDLTDDPTMDEAIEEGVFLPSDKGTKFELLWDYVLYHTRWEELEESDFSPNVKPEKGADSRIRVQSYDEESFTVWEGIAPDGTNATEYLKKIIQDCKARDIEVLITFLPCADADAREANRVRQIAEDNDVNFINFLELDVVNYATDCYDGMHLNPSGARKVSDYVGRYIMDNYDIADHRGDVNYDYWNKDSEKYVEFKNDNICAEEDLYNYLMLPAEDDLEMIIDIKNKKILDDHVVVDLLHNLGVSYDENMDDVRAVIVDSGSAAVIHDNLESEYTIGQSPAKYTVFVNVEDACYGIAKDGETIYKTEMNSDADLSAVVRRNDKQIDSVDFCVAMKADGSVAVLEAIRPVEEEPVVEK